MKNELYYGIKKIADRLGVQQHTAKELINKGLIKAFRLSNNKNAPWCCIESELSEDIKNLRKKVD